MSKNLTFLCVAFVLVVLEGQQSGARSMIGEKPLAKNNLPEAQQRVHRVGNVYFCNTNWGFLGSQTRGLYESKGGCFNPNPEMEVQAPSFETPPNSGIEYLFQGALWIGAIVEKGTEIETLVTVGADGWWWMYEMAPGIGVEYGIVEKSVRSEAPCYSGDALSDQDVIGIFSDTADAPLTQWDIATDWDRRPHHPLGVEITQSGYSWSLPEYDDFIILSYQVRNIGAHNLSEIYLGFFMDTDVMHISENPYAPEAGAQDDVTGFLKDYVDPAGETTEVNIAWAADNDGQPRHGGFGELSSTSVIGMRLLGCSNPYAKVSYNWWVSNTQGYPADWGPWLKANQDTWEGINPYSAGPLERFPDNAMGTPGGDRSKYFLMSNGEIDFDQIFTEIIPDTDTSWVPGPIEWSDDFVQGFDSKFLYSFGPFDLSPGQSIFAVLALLAGENLHVDPFNRYNLPSNPGVYYSNLHFSGLVENAMAAQELYDAGLDLIPPAPIRGLRGGPVENGSVAVTWVATGDNGNLGSASYYDLRYSGTAVGTDTISWWELADTAVSQPMPSPAGWIDSCRVSDLSPDSVYYFVVVAYDDVGYCSRFSNIAYGGVPGDVDLDREVDVFDIVVMIEYVFRSGPQLPLLAAADVNGDCLVNLVDVVYLINYVFRGGISPQAGCA